MKKLIALSLALFIAFGLAAVCAAETANDAATPELTATAESPVEAETPIAPEDEAGGEAKAEAGWLKTAFAKLSDVQWYVWAMLALLVIFSIVLRFSGKMVWNSRKLSYAAMCIAISFVLSLVRLYRMPQGGSITLVSKLPLILFTMSFGPAYGLAAGCAAGLISLINEPYVIHPIQLLLDYPLALGAAALSYAAKLFPLSNDKSGRIRLAIATVLGYMGSFVMALLSGAVFFGEYAWEGYTAWGYSFVYNARYTFPECIAAVLIVLFVPGLARLTAQMRGRSAGADKTN